MALDGFGGFKIFKLPQGGQSKEASPASLLAFHLWSLSNGPFLLAAELSGSVTSPGTSPAAHQESLNKHAGRSKASPKSGDEPPI